MARESIANFLNILGFANLEQMRRRNPYVKGTNPCGEILLDDRQTCNLTEINMAAFVNPDGTYNRTQMLEAQAMSATIGYRMATIELELHKWNTVAKRDMLLGCSLTGLADFINLTGILDDELALLLQDLRDTARQTADKLAERLKFNKSLNITCCKPSGCWTKDHTRTLDNGILFIDEINPSVDNVSGFAPIEGFTTRGLNIPHTFTNDIKPVHKITLAKKRELKVSPEHPMAVIKNGKEEWIKAKDIKQGDQLVYNLNAYTKTTECELNTNISEQDKRAIIHTLPTHTSPEFGYLLGAYYANGSFTTKSRIKFSCQHLPIIEKTVSLWEQLFGFSPGFTRASQGRNAYALDFASTQIREFFALNGVDKNADLQAGRIPKVIRMASAETVRAFILGYADNDGCFSAETFCIDSTNKAFMQHMQEVGESVGFCFSLVENSKRAGGYSTNTVWKLRLQRQHTDKYVFELANQICVKAQDRPVRGSDKSHTKPYEVLSNEIIEEQVTYDIEVDTEHWYYQGGLKSHNTVSLLANASAGIHFQHSPYYIRRVRINNADPLCQAMQEMGFVSHPENGQTEEDCTTRVFEFPMKSPKGATKFDVSAIRQLELYKLLMEHYVDHNASNTISVFPEEWDQVVDWVYKNWDSVVGMTFLELTSDYYSMAPYESITEKQYNILLESTPSFDANTANENEDFSDLLVADIEACTAGHCPIR